MRHCRLCFFTPQYHLFNPHHTNINVFSILHPTPIPLHTICLRFINTQTISTCPPISNPIVATSKTFFEVAPPNYTTKHATNLLATKRQPHNLNKVSMITNHQQEFKPIFFLSNHIETPEAIQQYSSHPLRGTLPLAKGTPKRWQIT